MKRDPYEFAHDGITLRLTSPFCPEQYDAFDKSGERVGYLRLRHGEFTVRPSPGSDETLLYGDPRGDGEFDDDEREDWLKKACTAIKESLK